MAASPAFTAPPEPSSASKRYDPDKPAFAVKDFSWDEYIQYRPRYRFSYYDRIFTYHAEHSSSWAVAHDSGAGPAVVSEELIKKFRHVHVSDPNEEYIEIAQQRLSSLGHGRDKFTFHAESAERSSMADSSVDLLVIAEAIHWCDVPVAMKESARQLKPGGTMAVSFYANPWFPDHPKATEKWNEIFARYGEGGNRIGGVYRRGNINMGNGMLNVPFDLELWEPGVKRIWINTKGNLDFMSFARPAEQPVDRSLKSDDRKWIEHDSDWTEEDRDLDHLRHVFKTFMIGARDEDIDRWWPAMEAAFGGKDTRFTMVTPVAIVLGTRRRDAGERKDLRVG